MAMRAATVGILIDKARFEPRVAVAIAEAMDEALESRARHLQPVTIPMFEKLDAKVTMLDGKTGALELKIDAARDGLRDKMDRDKTDLMRWTLLTMMSLFAMVTGMMYFMLRQFR